MAPSQSRPRSQPSNRPGSRPSNRPSNRPDELTLTLPASWRRLADPDNGLLVAASAPRLPASGVRPGLTLRCEPVPGRPPDPVADWHAASLRDRATRLAAFDLEDEDEFDLADRAVSYCRYAHRRRGVELLSDEWAWLVEGVGFVLTCTAAREDYPDLCDVFDSIAEAFEPYPVPRPA